MAEAGERGACFALHVFGRLGHASNSRDGAVHFVCMDWRHIAELMAAAFSPLRIRTL
jgi:hypothetical protein